MEDQEGDLRLRFQEPEALKDPDPAGWLGPTPPVRVHTDAHQPPGPHPHPQGTNSQRGQGAGAKVKSP